MSLNWKELQLLISEMPLKGSFIQDITEHTLHSFTFSLFSREEKSWLLYAEILTNHSRVCATKKMRKKNKTMQRFTQYLKAHVRGKEIIDVHQFNYDRAFILTLRGKNERLKLLFRLYSGPGANIVVLSEDNTILELMFRRPKRGEIKGEKLLLEDKSEDGSKEYEVRQYSTESFNEYIDENEERSDSEEKREEYLSLLKERRDKLLNQNRVKKEALTKRIKALEGYEETKNIASLFASNLYRYKKGMDSIVLNNWEDGREVTISLSPSLSGNENLSKLYDKYHKDKKAYLLALEESENIEKEREKIIERFEQMKDSTLDKIKKAYLGEEKTNEKIVPNRSGLYIKSGDWQLIVGRNAKENDAILRQVARGNDLWLHTRDFAGGYVIIKTQKGKSVPLNVLLDAAYLAIFFSKARKNNKADLYYTYVKNLKRIKGAKEGLIIPLMEKNLTVELDEKRLNKLLE